MAAMMSRILESQRVVDPEVVAFQQFFGAVAANPSVQLIGVNPMGGYLDLWVRLADDDEANEDAVYAALSAYHATPGIADLTPIELHVVFADERTEAYPSSVNVLYRRA